MGKRAVQENCLRCHNELLENMLVLNTEAGNHDPNQGRLCWECHREVPHGRVKSVSSTPNAIIKLPYGE
jgi:cytochrome c nitrite reductase small subunit